MSHYKDVPPKACERCGDMFSRRREPSGRLETAPRFALRKFCSPECGRARRAEPKKQCEVCDETFGRATRPGGTLESSWSFAKRKYCSRKCTDAAQLRREAQRAAELIEDVAWIVPFDNPLSVAQRVGYAGTWTGVRDLEQRMRDLGRPDLAERLADGRRRYTMTDKEAA